MSEIGRTFIVEVAEFSVSSYSKSEMGITDNSQITFVNDRDGCYC